VDIGEATRAMVMLRAVGIAGLIDPNGLGRMVIGGSCDENASISSPNVL
jgi:hypothetical protein